MSFKSLLEPITDQGIENTHFFEGRVLSANDLRQQVDANRRYDQQLGEVLGSGIVRGLNVSIVDSGAGASGPVVRVQGGMGLNLEGNVLELSSDYMDIELSRSITAPDPDTIFSDCNKAITETSLPSGAGLYVLLMSPAAKYQGYAPKNGLQARGVANDCGRATVVEGVQFRLLEFNPLAMPDISESTRRLLEETFFNSASPILSSDTQSISKLQNIIAHVCLGSEVSKRSQSTILTTVSEQPVGFDALYGEGIEPCDIPLAMIYWTVDGIGFLDNWSVKRQLYQYFPVNSGFSYSGKRTQVIYESMLYQFQDQLHELLVNKLNITEALSLNAFDYFQYLPPAGLLPLFQSSAEGFSPENFFARQPHRPPEYVSDSQAREILYGSANYQPIATDERELVWLYRTWERDLQEANGQPSLAHMIFTCGHTPYQANAKYDLARWDYSHYTRA